MSNPQIKVEDRIAETARNLPMTASNVETAPNASGSDVAGTAVGETRNEDARFFAALIDNIDGGVTLDFESMGSQLGLNPRTIRNKITKLKTKYGFTVSTSSKHAPKTTKTETTPSSTTTKVRKNRVVKARKPAQSKVKVEQSDEEDGGAVFQEETTAIGEEAAVMEESGIKDE